MYVKTHFSGNIHGRPLLIAQSLLLKAPQRGTTERRHIVRANIIIWQT